MDVETPWSASFLEGEKLFCDVANDKRLYRQHLTSMESPKPLNVNRIRCGPENIGSDKVSLDTGDGFAMIQLAAGVFSSQMRFAG